MGAGVTEQDVSRTDLALSNTILFRMMVAMNLAVRPFVETLAHRLGLSLPEWRCMMALATVPDSSGQDVARMMGIDQMTVSRSLRRLEKTGRAQRRTDPRNRKRFQWRLLDKGWSDYDVISPTALMREEELLSPLTNEQKALLKEVLEIIIARE